jgi:hypothetical protein
MFDEASDISMRGSLNVFINISDPSGEMLTKTVALTEIDPGDAESVYGKVMEALETSEIPLCRIVGLCSDGASTMLGCWRGVCARLLKRLREERKGILQQIAAPEKSLPPTARSAVKNMRTLRSASNAVQTWV